MRPLRWLVAACCCLTLAACDGKGSDSGSVDVGKPAATVFKYLTQLELRKQWVGGLVEAEQLTPGDLHVGSRIHEVKQVGGQRMDMQAEVVGLDPDHGLTLHVTSDGFDMVFQYRLEEAGSGLTHLSYQADMAFSAFMPKLMAAFLFPDIHKALAEDHARLAGLLAR